MERLRRLELPTSTLARLAPRVVSALFGKDLPPPSLPASQVLRMEGPAQAAMDHLGRIFLEAMRALGPDVLRRFADAFQATESSEDDVSTPNSSAAPASPAEATKE